MDGKAVNSSFWLTSFLSFLFFKRTQKAWSNDLNVTPQNPKLENPLDFQSNFFFDIHCAKRKKTKREK